MSKTIETHLTRSDCSRDDVRVICRNSSLLGFSSNVCKRGFWVLFEVDCHKFVGRSLGRVTCEGQIYIEVAQATEDFSSVHIRWVDPNHVREVRRNPPRRVFEFFAADREGWQPEPIFRALEYGVSDMHDQLDAWMEDYQHA